MKLSNWGNYPHIDCRMKAFRNMDGLREIFDEFPALISRGLGRCYGDSSLWQSIVSTLKFNRVLAFDESMGIMRCQAGVSLGEVLEISVPRGWFLPVTPGTKHVTVGGAIASDVHGKNHHKEGTFSDHLISIDVVLQNGQVLTCSHSENSELFNVVCGGMGLTCLILSAAFRLKKIETAYISQKTIRAGGLDEIMDLFEECESATYSVAWIDCLSAGKNLGRSILILGEHAEKDDIKGMQFSGAPLGIKTKKRLNVPFRFPSFVLNRVSAKAFNALYFHASKSSGSSIIGYDSFFYPLDAIENWNRIYGTRGFTQYQFVLPKDESKRGLRRILEKIHSGGEGVFLAVLKLFGSGNDNLLSFPMKGYTLALDFPITPALFGLFGQLDKIVLEFGGRLYLAKDARMNGEMFRKSYEKAARFIELKYQFDGPKKFRSLQSDRLEI
jgi:decaprenylphospho-beta-D-ribofuranose 2-oxidase